MIPQPRRSDEFYHAWVFTDFPNGELVEFAADLLADLARGTCCPFALVDLLDLYRAATA